MKEFVTQLEPYPPLCVPCGVSDYVSNFLFFSYFSLVASCVSLSLSLPDFPTLSHTISSSFYSLPLMDLPSWVMVFPKKVGPILTYILDLMGLTTHFWIYPVGTCANLQIYAQQANIPKALCDILGDALGWFVLYHARTFYHLFGMTWMGLTHVGLGLGPVFDLWTIHV